MRTRRRAGVTLVLLLSTVVLVGCDEGAEMRVDLLPADRFPEVTLAVEDRNGTRVFERDDLTAPQHPASPGGLSVAPSLTTGSFEVAEAGLLEVRIAVTEGGATVTEGAVRFDAIEDFRWNVHVAYQVEDPTSGCFGCRGAEAFPVAEAARAAPAESLWIWWAGRRRGSDLVF